MVPVGEGSDEGEDEGGNEPADPYTVVKGWYLDADSEGWAPGGKPSSYGYDKSKTAYKLETNTGAWGSLKGPDASSDALTLEDFDTIRIQVTGGTPNGVFSLTTSFYDAGHTASICKVDARQVTLDEEGKATIEVDCSEATLGEAGVLQTIRFDVSSTALNTIYIDSIELVK